MLFLIHYDRNQQKLVRCDEFVESDIETAQQERLSLELDVHRRGLKNQEIVILDAADKEALRVGHAQYFKDFADIIRSLVGANPQSN